MYTVRVCGSRSSGRFQNGCGTGIASDRKNGYGFPVIYEPTTIHVSPYVFNTQKWVSSTEDGGLSVCHHKKAIHITDDIFKHVHKQ